MFRCDAWCGLRDLTGSSRMSIAGWRWQLYHADGPLSLDEVRAVQDIGFRE